jgi:hypothetical protein
VAVSPFEFHTGLHATQSGSQFIMDCPFCGKEEKFYYNTDNLWDCKNVRCKKSGNILTFLRFIYEMFDNITETSKKVAEMRGLPLSAIQPNGLKYNVLNNTIIIPTYKNGKINNLYKVVTSKKFNKDTKEWHEGIDILATPGVEHCPMNWQETFEDTIWICEGHWDKIAGDAIVGPGRGISPLGVPGAGVWKTSWCQMLAEKNVVFCYDNDMNGKVGFERVILKEIAQSQHKPRNISYLKWPEDKPEKYDLNDAYKEYGRNAFKQLTEWIVPFEAPEGTVVVKTSLETVPPDLSCDTFEKLLLQFQDVYHTTDDMKLGLALVLTSIYSTRIGGEQLWFRLIGPPGSGKTTIAKAVSSSEQVVLKSTFTGLFSGWRDDSGEDKSLVPIIAGKTLIVKDADALLRQQNVERIFSELRDFYDKDSSTGYRHGFNHDYRNIRSTMILCGTNVLRRSDSSFLGERFLTYELRITSADEEKIMHKMMQRTMQEAADPGQISPETPVQASAGGFLQHLMEKNTTHKLDLDTQKLILKLAWLAAAMRTQVDRDSFGKGEITFSPVKEVPSRLLGQLGKMSMCLPVVTGNDALVKPALKKVATDIIDPTSNRFRICQNLMEGWFSRDQLVESTDISRSTVTRELDNLRALGIAETKYIPTGVGRHRMVLTLTEEVKEGMITLGF